MGRRKFMTTHFQNLWKGNLYFYPLVMEEKVWVFWEFRKKIAWTTRVGLIYGNQMELFLYLRHWLIMLGIKFLLKGDWKVGSCRNRAHFVYRNSKYNISDQISMVHERKKLLDFWRLKENWWKAWPPYCESERQGSSVFFNNIINSSNCRRSMWYFLNKEQTLFSFAGEKVRMNWNLSTGPPYLQDWETFNLDNPKFFTSQQELWTLLNHASVLG